MGSCRLCGAADLTLLLDLGQHPIAHHFLTSPTQEEYVHQVTLCLCERCGLIQLLNPIPPELLYTEYVCLSSWKHQPHMPRLIELIGQLPGLAATSGIVEVGSNDGTFLGALRQRGFRNVIGIEPARDAQEAARSKGIETVGGYFTRESAEELVARSGQCQVLIARQVLEHIGDLRGFGQAIQRVLAPGGFVVIEVPNFTCNLSTLDYTLWEEHVNYFTPETLGSFLVPLGIEIVHRETTVFSGETLIIVGKASGNPSAGPGRECSLLLRTQAFAYRELWPVFRDAFIQCVREHRERGTGIAMYGAGARVCSLINFLGLGPYLEVVFDDQQAKQGKFMPGSGLPIVPGHCLETQGIGLCLLGVNTECEEMVIAKHRSWQEQGGRFASVLPPSDRLLEVWHELDRTRVSGPRGGAY